MSSDGRAFEQEITADPSKFVKGFEQAKVAATGGASAIDAQFKKIGDSVAAVNKAMLGFVAVLAGGGALKKFISDANEWNGSAGKMAAQLGITTQKASAMNVALNRLGLDSDVALDAAQKLSKSVQTNAQAFEVLGVKVRDVTTGAYRPITEVMGEVNQKLAEIKNPIEQNIAGQQIYGKGWSEMRGLLKLTTQAMAEAEVRGRQLGLIVGPEGAAMSRQYSIQMRELGLVGKSLEIQFGNQLLPVFTRLGSFMAQEGPVMGQVFGRVLEGIGFAAASTWLALKDMGDGIGAMAAQAAALLSGDLAGAQAIGKMRDQESAKNQAAYEKLKADFGKPLTMAMPTAPDLTKGPQYKFKEKEEKTTDPKGRVAEWDARLAQDKAALEREGLLENQFREMSKSAELAYWQDLLKRKDLTDTEKAALSRKAAEVEMAMVKQTFDVKVKSLEAEAERFKNNTGERMRLEQQIQGMYQSGTAQYEESRKRMVAIERQAAEQQKQIAQQVADAKRLSSLAAISMEEQAAQLDVELGLTTRAELLQQETTFEQRRYEIAGQALQDRLQIFAADPDRNPVEVQRVHNEIEALEQQHQLRLGQIRNQTVLEQSANYRSMFGSLESSWGQLISKFLQGGLTFANFIKGATRSVAQAGIDMVSQMAAKWLITQLAQRVLGKATKTGEVQGHAAVAGAAAVASTAAIPIVGPILAPAAGAAAFATAMSFLPGVLASAAGGYDIPGTVNPLVQAHAKEMILPAKYADVIRDMANGPGGEGGWAPPQLVVHPLPGNFFMVHRDHLVAALTSAKRDGALKL